MTYQVNIADNKISFAEEFFKSISFVQGFRVVPSNEITNPAILQSIEAYESGAVPPTPFDLATQKEMMYA
ncbi:hypothetical protein FACS189456_3930 [Bacteroidia bacterium]|nr:hypothetical protein FACS189456_3930 [Bacteroidia bacterium]